MPVLDQEHISKYFDLVSYSTGLQVYWLCTLYETFYPLSPLLSETFFAMVAHHSFSDWLLHPNFWIFVSVEDFLPPLLHQHPLSQVFQNLLLVNLFWFPPQWQYFLHCYLHLKSYLVHHDLPLNQWRYVSEKFNFLNFCKTLPVTSLVQLWLFVFFLLQTYFIFYIYLKVWKNIECYDQL